MYGDHVRFSRDQYKMQLKLELKVRYHHIFSRDLLLIILELDKSRAAAHKSGGGSLFGSKPVIPNELAPLLAPQQAITKHLLQAKTPIINAKNDYEKMMDPNATIPIPPVRAARLNGLLGTLASAEVAVAEGIKARKLLIEGLEKILSTNQATLLQEEAQLKELSTRRAEINAKKKEVEDSILRGHSATPSDSPGMRNSPQTPVPEPDRPEVEALTPPTNYSQIPQEPIPDLNLGSSNSHSGSYRQQTQAGADLFSSLSGAQTYTGGYATGGSLKKRKLSPGDEIPDFGDDLDADVTAMLNS